MNQKLGKRLFYLGIPALGVVFCLYYLKIATTDLAYTDYMRLIVSYLPDVGNPAKFFVPDVLTRVPITYLGRIINVALFHYSPAFDMVLGVLSHGLSALAIAAYCRGKRVIGVDELGGLKVAYIMGETEEEKLGRLAVSAMNLQKLFVKLTEQNERGEGR